MRFPFNLKQSIQSAGFLLNLSGGHMDYMKLLKLLYISDRDYLRTNGETITGDDIFALPRGPVLSHIYSYIRPSKNWTLSAEEQANRQEWTRFIQTDEPSKQTFTVNLLQNTGDDDLSQSIEECLGNVYLKFIDYDQFQISEYTHKFHEWAIKQEELLSGNKGSVPMDWADALYDKPDMIRAAQENISMLQANHELALAAGLR